MSTDVLLRSIRESDHRSWVRAAYAQSTLSADLGAFEAVARSAFSNVITAAHSSGGRMAASELVPLIARVELAQRPWRVPPQYLEAVIVAALAATTTDSLAHHDYAVKMLQDEGMGSVAPASNPGLRPDLPGVPAALVCRFHVLRGAPSGSSVVRLCAACTLIMWALSLIWVCHRCCRRVCAPGRCEQRCREQGHPVSCALPRDGGAVR